jgi:hypothetical protein
MKRPRGRFFYSAACECQGTVLIVVRRRIVEGEPVLLELEPPPPHPLNWKMAKATMAAMPVRTNDRCMIFPAALIIRLLVNRPSFCGQILLPITHNLDRASSLD